MAVYKIFPTQDSTIYSNKPYNNSGLDEILEIYNINNYKNDVARTLIKFDELFDYKNRLVPSGSNVKVNLKLYIAKASSLKEDLEINIHPVLKNWKNGTGKTNNNYSTNDGVSWNKFDEVNYWDTPGGDFDVNVSSSLVIGLNSNKDINISIDDIFEYWEDNPNEGLLIKLKDEYEFNPDIESQPDLKYFSSNTHTIYPPHLELKWDDSNWDNVSQLQIIEDSEIYSNIGNNKGEFEEGSVHKFRVNVRPKYPKRKYQIKSVLTDNFILPENACYLIKDLATNEIIIDFDETFTKLSCDKKGNYFNLYMNGLQPERYYEILIKYEVDNQIILLNNKSYFKIKRNING